MTSTATKSEQDNGDRLLAGDIRALRKARGLT
ncbi:XRE family transcriptional regulator, partial [Mesorhizobium sp. M2C.T.Ca.TU.009.01.2.1]